MTLHAVGTPEPTPPNQMVIEILEEALAEARAGTLVQAGIAGITEDGCMRHWMARGIHKTHFGFLLGAIDWLHARVMEKMREAE